MKIADYHKTDSSQTSSHFRVQIQTYTRDVDPTIAAKFDPLDPLSQVLPRRTESQLKKVEVELLAQNLSVEPIIVWDEMDRLMVGYDEWPIIVQYNLEHQIVRVSCADEADARAWIWSHQMRGRGWRSKFEQIEWSIKNFKEHFKTLAKAQQGKRTDIYQESDESFEPIRWDVEVGKMCSPPVGKSLVAEVDKCIHTNHPSLAAISEQGKEDADEILEMLREGTKSINRGRWMFDKRTRELRRDAPADHPIVYDNPDAQDYVNNIFAVKSSPAEILSQIPENVVSAYISSYPYFCGKDYGSGAADDDIPYNDQIAFFVSLGVEQFRTLRPGGRLVINVDSMTARSDDERRRHYKRPIVADLIQGLRKIGFLHYEQLTWHKPNEGMKKTAWGSYMSPSCPVAIRHEEAILVMSKPSEERENPFRLVQDEHSRGTDLTKEDWELVKNALWDIPIDTKNYGGHPCPYPVELVRRLLLRYTWINDWVIDPFVGTGTTTMVANQMGRRWTGIDKQARWCRDAFERTTAA